jgi:hypothetical protein
MQIGRTKVTSICKPLLPTIVCSAAFCQQQPAPPPLPPPGKPSDLAMSCSVDADSRTATVTIINSASAAIEFSRVGPRFEYEAELTGKSGGRLPRHERPPPKPGVVQVWQASRAGIFLDPKQQYTEEVPLGDLVDIPESGGRFRVRLGRALFAPFPPTRPFHLDPSGIVWCKAIDVTFPPLK